MLRERVDQRFNRRGNLQQPMELGVEGDADDALGDVAVAAGGAYRGEDGLASRQRLEVPEAHLAREVEQSEQHAVVVGICVAVKFKFVQTTYDNWS